MVKPGSLLIAHPLMKPNMFSNSVILITEQHNKKYKGLIVNKNSSYQVSELVPNCSQSCCGQTYLYSGGPVNPTALIMLHSNEWYSTNTMQINSEVAISSDTTMLSKISMDNLPFEYRLVAGMSVWSETQLKAEMRAGPSRSHPYWMVLNDFDPKILFEEEQKEQWNTAVNLYAQTMFDQYF